MAPKTKNSSTRKTPPKPAPAPAARKIAKPKTEAPMIVKPKVEVPITMKAVPRPQPSHEKIAVRAYEIFAARGYAHGYHEQDWLQAERELS